jgi:hypothetical protein
MILIQKLTLNIFKILKYYIIYKQLFEQLNNSFRINILNIK